MNACSKYAIAKILASNTTGWPCMVLCRERIAEKWDAVQNRRAMSGKLELPSVHVKDVMPDACPDLQLNSQGVLSVCV